MSVIPPLYVAISVAGVPLHNPARGRIQREVLNASDGMVTRPGVLEGTGLHGGTETRVSYGPGLITVDVDVVATTGSTTEQRDASYRANLSELQAICQGTSRVDALYGDGVTVRRTLGQCMTPLSAVGDIVDGRRHRVGITTLDFWRSPDPVTQPFVGGLADSVVLDLTMFAESTAPLVDLVLEIVGASDPLTISPRHRGAGAHAYGELIYAKELAGAEEFTIDTATGTLTSSVPANVDYRKLSHPGNATYHLEVPAGIGPDLPPQIRVLGGPQEVHVTGTLAWLAL